MFDELRQLSDGEALFEEPENYEYEYEYEVGDLGRGVHYGGVVASAEGLADLGQGLVGQFA